MRNQKTDGKINFSVRDQKKYSLLNIKFLVLGCLNYNGNGYAIRGGNHIAGTHMMGTNKNNSVRVLIQSLLFFTMAMTVFITEKK